MIPGSESGYHTPEEGKAQPKTNPVSIQTWLDPEHEANPIH